jgi:hypothetical protein
VHHSNENDRTSRVAGGLDLYRAPVTFERWWGQAPGPPLGSEYGQTVWLPRIGPAAWMLWQTLASRSEATGAWVTSIQDLADPLGLAVADVPLELLALARHQLVHTARADHWYVRTACPPPSDRRHVVSHYGRHYGPAVRDGLETGRGDGCGPRGCHLSALSDVACGRHG